MWIDFLENPEPIVHIFKQVPSLEKVELVEVSFIHDGPGIRLRINLNEFPDPAPEKWLKRGDNRVQLQLEALGVNALSWQGWHTENIVSIMFLSDSLR